MLQDLTAPATGAAKAIDELSALLPGQVISPGDPDWPTASLGWVRSVDQCPSAVVTVRDEEDVVVAVTCAARHGLAVSAQPVGHGATTALNGTILLRTRELRDITIDAAARVARVGAGVKWGELLAATEKFGLTGLAGSSPDPSVIGFTLGGGLSWFGRAYGLAAHSVVAVELVDAQGEPQRVTATSDPELFWALRGGGGDFGIVTAMDIALHPAPHVYGGRLLWPIEMAYPVLRAFRQITATAPDELTLWAHLFRFPPSPDVPEALRGGAFVSVDATYLGQAEAADRLLEPLRAIPAAWADTFATVPLSELGGIAAEPVDPMPIQETSALLKDFDDVAINALLDAVGAGSGSPLAVVQIRHLGGALATASQDDGPAGAVVERYQMFALGVPMAPELTAANEASFAALHTALGPYLTGRTLFNFLGSSEDPRRAFSEGALRRLEQVKRRTDPAGVFRSNRPYPRAA